MVSAGAEALSYETEDAAEDNGWHCVKGIPLYLSAHLAGMSDSNLDPLPPGVSLSTIYTDYLNYLLQHTIEFFVDRMVDGRAIWRDLSPDMMVVFIHPQGWSAREEAFLRTALRKLESPYSDCEVRFISQPAVWTLGYLSDLKPSPATGGSVLVCHIGKSSTEVTTYEIERIVAAHNLGYQTNSRLETGFGAITQNCRLHLSGKLRSAGLSPGDVQEYSSNGAKDFEHTAMRVFTSSQQEQSIEIGGPRFNNSEMRIRRGRMTVDGKTMEGFFEPCISVIVEEIQRQKANYDIQHIIVVEGVGTSRYLQHRLNQHFDSTGCRITYAPKSVIRSLAQSSQSTVLTFCPF
ncbi:hypothetical protein FRC10_002438 [Ceratobasidium sp. 414]|nr:hypothetical protein FRC10_002438 [Ceratobasidium sp. 414]